MQRQVIPPRLGMDNAFQPRSSFPLVLCYATQEIRFISVALERVPHMSWSHVANGSA